MKKIFSATLVLVLITLVAGLALAAVYQITQAPIAAAEEKARQEAYRVVMPDAAGFFAVGVEEAATYPVAMEDGVTINACLTAQDAAGNYIGYVVNVTSPNGYGGDITLAVGILHNGTIQGISVISQGETAGLGATCAEDKFTSQFSGIKGYVEYVKTGKTEPNQIDAISGATITTKAVTEAVNAAVDYVADFGHIESAKEGS